MPFYEFKCEGGHITDLHCRMSEKPREVECSKCGHSLGGISMTSRHGTISVLVEPCERCLDEARSEEETHGGTDH